MLIEITGFIASFTSIISLLPQILKTYRTKSVEDLSMLMLLNFLVCSVSWTVYGILTDALWVWTTNSIMTVFSGILLGLKVRYAK